MGLRPEPGMDLAPGWRRKALKIAPGTLSHSLRHFREVREFLTWWDKTAAEAGDLESLDAEALVALYRRLWAEVGVRWGVTLTNTILGIFPAAGYDGSLRRWTGTHHRALFGALLAGGPENRTLAGLRSALDVAEVIAARPDARERILAATPADDAAVWQEIIDGAHGPDVAEAALRQLRVYGDRAVGDLKLEQLTPRQRPGMVLDMLRPHLRQGATAEASRADERRVRENGERDLREHCRNPLRRAVIRFFAQRWLDSLSGAPGTSLEVDTRRLRVVDTNAPSAAPATPPTTEPRNEPAPVARATDTDDVAPPAEPSVP